MIDIGRTTWGWCLATVVAAARLAGQAAPDAPAVRGFPRAMLADERAREDALRAVPSPDTLRAQLVALSAVPHEAGTERSHRVAETILARFRSFGLDASIEPFEALMPRPVSRSLQLLAPERYTAGLKEPPVPGDSTSGQPDQLPTFNAYSPDGDVTGDLVYVNYGVPDDYRVLDSLGISVRGRIVIARYGRSWRGIKPKVAAEHGAIGCLIYSDPRDDGYFQGDTYPRGPMRPPQGVQRGSVMDMPLYPGDPLSPGWASEPGSRRLSIAEARTLATIPVLPISYGDALPFLRSLAGPVAPPAWRGALPITYHVGPGPARARLAVRFDWKTRPLYDVIATIHGAVHPDEWVLYGNHHDAWVNGAADPISGQISLDETARALGALLRTGWRPSRTIVLAAWDGEEWGLLGSTEWAEKHADELSEKAVVYFNGDANEAGWFGASGSPSLEAFLREVARDVPAPTDTTRSALDASERHRREQPARDSTGSGADTAFAIGALGSGSDYTVFVDHLAVASLDVRFGGATEDGIYHSVYDDPAFYLRFLDSTLTAEVAEARTIGTAILRMADAPVLPFEFGGAARHLGRWVDELARLAATRDSARRLDLGPLRQAIARLGAAASRYDSTLARLDAQPAAQVAARAAALDTVNRLLYRSERAVSDTAGLPVRPWFRNLLYAPGLYTGYGVKTIPGIREALELGKPDEAVAQAARVTAAVTRLADQVDRAAAALGAALQ
ncbi:MAG TPA: transferrin receptor-like dimerization domain-containing protein [Gemmatimonadales bacterium]|nr:transferrin receptor-like dimerization domain-containing protein [Gemmatimonadales bacterium]